MSTRSRCLASAIVLAITFSLAISSPAIAKKKREAISTYVVPFTCGPNDASEGGVVAGEYATAISVTNPSAIAAMARARIAITSPRSTESDRIRRALPAGSSFLIDCEALSSVFMLPEPRDPDSFFQGVLIIDSLSPLNVVAQASATGRDGGISVQSRQVPGSRTVQRRARHDDEEICHIPPGNPDNRHTIRVGESAVSAHMAHGDHRGECDDDRGDD